MRIKLGLIGPKDALSLIEGVLKETENLKIFDYTNFEFTITKHSEEDLESIIENNTHLVDAFIFSGIVSYNIAKKLINISRPYYFISHNSTFLYKALWHLKEREIPLDRISFDMMKATDIQEALDEVGLSKTKVYHYEYNENKKVNAEEIADWHYGLWASGKTSAAISCLSLTNQILDQKGVPAFRLIYPKSMIRNTLDYISQDFNNKILRATQIAVVLINIDNFSKTIVESHSEYTIQKIKLELFNLLLDFSKDVQGAVFNFAGDEYILFATRGALVAGTNHYEKMSFMQQIRDKLPITVSFGIGLGKTVYSSVMNARMSLSYAKESGGDCGYLIEEDKSIKGPLGKDLMLQYSLVNDNEIIKIAKTVGVSATYISKLKSIRQVIGEEVISSNTLAPYLNMTERSARRILGVLFEKGYAEIVGEESSGSRGRPRKLYKMKF